MSSVGLPLDTVVLYLLIFFFIRLPLMFSLFHTENAITSRMFVCWKFDARYAYFALSLPRVYFYYVVKILRYR